MTVSELIGELTKFQKSHGDAEIHVSIDVFNETSQFEGFEDRCAELDKCVGKDLFCVIPGNRSKSIGSTAILCFEKGFFNFDLHEFKL